MRSLPRVTSRALVILTAAGSTLVFAGPASAHVRVESDHPAPGSTAVVTFRVPGESETGALTTQLSVMLPDVTSARTEAMPGWTAHLDRDVTAGTVRSVTWTAAPGTGISTDQFALFRLSVKLPQGDAVNFPATQTYSDGKVVRWDQQPLPDGGEPEYPAPTLSLTGASAAATSAQSTTSDATSRWLSGGALAVAAVAVAAALLIRRRA